MDRKPPPIPDWYREPGTPQPVDPDKATVVSSSIFTLDEQAFMQAVANRLNAFISTYPLESQHVLAQFIPYQHELVQVHNDARAQNRAQKGLPPEPVPSPAGITIGQLFAALLQTHHGNGYVLKPVVLPDPDTGPGCVRIARFVVSQQEDLASDHTA